MQYLVDIVKEKNVLFITTKNVDYIRNAQELRLISDVANAVEIIASEKKNYVARILHVWSQISKKKVLRNDLVFIGFEPQFVLPFVGRKFKGKQVIIDFFISVYDTVICDRKMFKDNGIISKLCHWMDRTTLSMAEHVITDTKAHAEFFVEEFCGNTEKMETIYLEADTEIYYPRPQNKSEELKDKYVVLYFGSILPLQGVDVVLDAIRLLKNEKNIFFEVIGPISQKYNKPKQDNVKYIDWLPQDELAEHIANADLCLAGHFNNTIEKANRTVPGKAYIYDAMKKNMILGDGIANREYFRQDCKHIFVPMGDASQLSSSIQTICKEERYEKVE